MLWCLAAWLAVSENSISAAMTLAVQPGKSHSIQPTVILQEAEQKHANGSHRLRVRLQAAERGAKHTEAALRLSSDEAQASMHHAA